MSKLTQYVCDVCGTTSTSEAEMTSVNIALSNSVRVKEAAHVHYEHVCSSCMERIKRALNLDENGNRQQPRVVQLRHEAVA